MSMLRVGLSSLTCILGLVLGGLLSAGAWAAPAGWMVNKTTLTTTAAFATTAKVDQKPKLKSAGITIECTGETINAISPQINEKNLMAEATSVEFTKCKSISAGCKLASEKINTLPILVDLTLDGSLAVRETALPEKTVFTTLLYEGETCALAGVQAITGKASSLAPGDQGEATVQLAFSTATEATGELKVGSSPASLEGSSLGRLASGQSWSFL